MGSLLARWAPRVSLLRPWLGALVLRSGFDRQGPQRYREWGVPGDRVSGGHSGAPAHQKGDGTHGGLHRGQDWRPPAAGRPQGRRGGNEDMERAALSLVASPGDETGCVTFETFPNLSGLPLPRGSMEILTSRSFHKRKNQGEFLLPFRLVFGSVRRVTNTQKSQSFTATNVYFLSWVPGSAAVVRSRLG